jgi:hypothetical protein
MLVKPPMIQQPQVELQKPLSNTDLPLQAEAILVNTNTELQQAEKPLVTQTPPENKILLIRKKREYKAFMKLVKQGKYTSAYVSSKLLGVDKNTILEWLHTPKVIECMNTEIDSFVSRINVSKDWKAQAYLLDKVIDNDKDTEQHITLNSMIQVNTVAPSTTKSGTVTI